jgi:hypothetical protein
MADEAVEQTATRKLFSDCWGPGKTQAQAVGASLLILADALDRDISKGKTAAAYVAEMNELRPNECILAFCRALRECKYFPPPATLREYSGRAADGDPIAREAKEQLLYVLEGMRSKHGPMLKPILGKVLYGTEDEPRDEDGRCAAAPIRAESAPFPLSRRTQAALARLGWGDSTRGIAIIAEHPALKRVQDSDDGQYRQNQLRAADEILKRFTDAYREV